MPPGKKYLFRTEYIGWYATCETLDKTNGTLCGKKVRGHTRHDAERKIRDHIRKVHHE